MWVSERYSSRLSGRSQPRNLAEKGSRKGAAERRRSKDYKRNARKLYGRPLWKVLAIVESYRNISRGSFRLWWVWSLTFRVQGLGGRVI